MRREHHADREYSRDRRAHHLMHRAFHLSRSLKVPSTKRGSKGVVPNFGKKW
jgi:hypothetical protein